MDNHYVPNLTIGPAVATAIKPHCVRADGTKVPLDVHLMVALVDALATAFAKAGADIITFHPDASAHVDRTLKLIRSEGCQAGLVFNPATPLDVLEWLIDKVDGGIKVDNIRRVADAGADTFVAGSAIFGQPDYREVTAAMSRALADPLARAA